MSAPEWAVNAYLESQDHSFSERRRDVQYPRINATNFRALYDHRGELAMEQILRGAAIIAAHAPKVDVEGRLKLFNLLEKRAEQLCHDNNISVYQGTAINAVLSHLSGGGK